MDGQMKRYRESLKEMSEPIQLSQMPKTMDLRGLIKYAREKGVKVADLTETERISFLK